MIGLFGSQIFETSDRRVYTFNGFKLDNAGRFVSHDRIGQKPLTEFIGPGLMTISFTIDLNGNHKVKPREEMHKWLILLDKGTSDYLIINSNFVGSAGMWTLKSVSEAWNTIFNNGELFSGKIDLTFEEYAG